MAEYHKMYWRLFNEVTRAIIILQEVQAEVEVEEMYISGDEVELHLVRQKGPGPLADEGAVKGNEDQK